jgi:hypothetical protein
VLGLPPVVFFRNIPQDWFVSSTSFSTLTLMKISESEKIDTSITASSFQRSPNTLPHQAINEIRKAIIRPNSNFTPLIMEGETRVIGGRDFMILGGVFDFRDVGSVVQTGYLHLNYTETELNVIEIITTILFENALDDEPEIHDMLDKVIIANPVI